MAGIRKPPSLRQKTVNGTAYYVAEVWKPDGKRTTLSFGRADTQNAADIHVAFGKWLKLYQVNPHKTLGYANPFDAVTNMDSPSTIVSIGDFTRQYRRWADESFKLTRNGDVSPNYQRLVFIQKFLEPYADWPIASFGTDELRAVQKAMIAYRYRVVAGANGTEAPLSPSEHAAPSGKSLTRNSINEHLAELRRMWAWGVGRGVVPVTQERLLREVKMLRRGHPETTEGRRRRPITNDEFARALVGASSTTIADMMRCMWYAEFRPTEVCMVRPVDFDRRHPDCWLFIPGRDRFERGDHKTMDHDLPRAIPITRTLQAVLAPRLKACASPTQYVFSPKTATQEMVEKRFARRQTPLNSGNRSGTNRAEHPMIRPRDHYEDTSFCQAVKRACRRGGVDPYFTPYDIRRSTITRIRAIVGKDAAALLTGHANTETTDIYLLDEVQEAMKAAQLIDGKLG